MTTPTMMKSRVFGTQILLCLLALFQGAHSEIRPLVLDLEPASDYIHYVEGFIVAPGYIDLRQLQFWAADSGAFDDDDDYVAEDDGVDDDGVDDDGGGGRKVRLLDEGTDGDNSLDIGSDVDIAVFNLPSSCDKSREGCDWVELGIGGRASDGKPRYCCTEEAVKGGLCQDTQKGRLIMNSSKFAGQHRLMTIPRSGDYEGSLQFGKFEQREGNGRYVVVFANCNDEGRLLTVFGKTIWKSRHGYLPGNLFGLMYFLAFLFFIYFAMLLWFGVSMKMFEDANIPIQNWIFATISMGSLELFFRTGDLFVWNEDGTRFWVAFYVGVTVACLKNGISRCLLVMVSLGWGVIRDDLGSVMSKITFLGGTFTAVSLLHDIMDVVAYTEVQKLSEEEEDELFDIVEILGIVIVVLDVIFVIWILDAMNGTMEYLENMNQTSKLLRYLRLRFILLFAILFAIAYTVFGVVDQVDQGIVDHEQEWVLLASIELDYVFVLLGVATLWRPQENAKEYAYVMELPAMTDNLDDDAGEGELELSVVVPSADNGDEEEFNDEPK